MTNIFLQVRTSPDATVAGMTAMRIAAALGFGRRAAQELAIAVSELATNQVRHAGGGTIEIHATADAVEVTAKDAGPGIADLPAAVRDHHSNGRAVPPSASAAGGLGCGLGAVRRLMDEVRFEDVPSGGVCIHASKRRQQLLRRS